MACPEPEELARFADGLATAEESERLSRHIDTCTSCREVLVALARSSQPSPVPAKPPPDDLPERGTVVGRYVVLDSKGAGGMGLVVSAYDSQLDRKVALKLVRPDVEAQGGTENTRARLLREAQLMARVRHPNVLTVYEVGERGEQVFIAMELVEGHTLRAWLKEKPRSRPEILDIFLQAGRALAAAHAAGVVHRDFKPDNVLIDGTGRAQVTDFGLAWSGAPPSGTPLDRASPVKAGQATGIVGTPAYMAPEQLEGKGIDGRTDQFSFCVSLWEALTGQRPYQADDMRGLERAIAARNIVAPARRLPKRLESALRKGLEPSPAARFDTMEALLHELTPRVQRPGLWIAVAVASLAAVASFAFNVPRDSCNPDQPFTAVWDAARRAEMQRAFGAETRTFEAVAQAFDRRTAEWLEAWTSSCEATRVKKTQTEEVLVRQRVCLDGRLDELRALSELFSSPGPGVLENAGLAVARLKPARRCLSGDAFDALPLPTDPRQRQTIAQARLELARVAAHATAGQPVEALQSADTALELARLARYPPVEAEALLARVEPLRELARYEEAEKALESASLAAEAGRHFEAQFQVAVLHLRIIDSVRTEEADAWLRRAEAILEHARRPDLQAELDSTLSVLRLAQRRTAESRARASAALEYFDSSGEVARALAARHIAGLALRAQGKPEKALTELRAALSSYVAAMGATHPLTLHVQMHVVEALLDLGRPREALVELEAPEMLAPGKLTPAWEVNRFGLMGAALAMQGKLERASEVQRQGLARALSVPEGKRMVPGARRWLIPTLRLSEDFTAAEKEVAEAVQMMESAAHPPVISILLTRVEQALLEAEQGMADVALGRAKKASQALAPLLDAAAPERVASQLALAQVALRAREPQLSMEVMERLLALGLSEPAQSRATLLHALAKEQQGAGAQAPLLASLESLNTLQVFPEARLEALAALKTPSAVLAPCEGNASWNGVELGPRAQKKKAELVKRHCR